MKKTILALALVAGLTTVTYAQTMELTFQGHLTSVTSSSPFWNGISNGTSFTMTGYYDLTPAYTLVTDYTWADYQWDKNYNLSATFGSYNFSMNDPQIEIRNGLAGQNGFILGNGSYFSSSGLDINSTYGLRAFINTFPPFGGAPVVSSVSLNSITNGYSISNPSYGLDLFFGLSGTFNGGSDSAAVQGVVTSYSVQSVPEPSTYALLGIGAIGMLMVMRGKKVL